jgi:ABC-type multidrug transport system fused ATPase/permease subunit
MSPKRKKQLPFVIVGSFVIAVVEIASLAIIAYFISILASPTIRPEDSSIIRLLESLGIRLSLDWNEFIIALAFLVAFSVTVKNVVSSIIRYLTSYYSSATILEISQVLINTYLFAPYAWHLQIPDSEKIANIQNRIQCEQLLVIFFRTVSDIMLLIAISMVLFIYTPSISILLFLFLFPAGILITRGTKKNLHELGEQYRELNVRSLAESEAILTVLREIKNYRASEYFISRFKRMMAPVMRLTARMQNQTQISSWILESTAFIALAVVMAIVLSRDAIDAEDLFSSIAIIGVASWRLLPIMFRVLQGVSSLRSKSSFIRNIIDHIEGPAPNPTEIKIEPFKSIVFSDVSYRYPVKDADEGDTISNVTFEIRKGEMLGIIGHSGAGKSTVLDLLSGLISPVNGSILLNDTELDSVLSHRIRIGYVSQTPYLFADTLEENLLLGREGLGMDITDLVEKVHLQSSKFKDPKFTLAENGKNLSGGEKQRVSIMRSIIADPDLILFDEATSSLDTKTEEAILKTINELKGERTIVMIAHRLTTVEKCHRIIWMEDGRIVKVGTPDQIIKEYSEYTK